MRPLRIKAIARKEFIQILRDPMSLAMAFLLPVILLFIYGYAITFDVDELTTVVYDRDRTSESRELVNQFTQSGYFTVLSYLERYDDIDKSLDRGDAKVAITIPVNFGKDLRRGGVVSLGVIIDGSNSNTATIAQGYVSAIAEQYSRRISGGLLRPLIESRTRVWYNTELKSRNFIIPGLIAMIMAVIVALLTSLTVSREWDRGTMEQLISTPVKPAELVIGKLIPYFVIGFIDTVIAVLMSTLLFAVPLRGSIPMLFALSSIFLVGGLSMGILISVGAKNQTMASQVAMITTLLPAFLLSGFIFSISNMPAPLRAITYLIPARYFVTILKGIFLKGLTFKFLMVETLLLAVYAIIVFALAVKKLRKRID
jgi:ABC-2 type transport system permease protein